MKHNNQLKKCSRDISDDIILPIVLERYAFKHLLMCVQEVLFYVRSRDKPSLNACFIGQGRYDYRAIYLYDTWKRIR